MGARALFFLTILIAADRAAAANLQITELHDLTWQNVTTDTNNLRGNIVFCVNMNPAGPYQLRVIGQTRDGDYALTDSSGTPSIRFRLSLSGARGGGRGGGRDLLPGAAVRGLHAPRPRRDGSCQPPRARMRVEIDTNDLRSARSGQHLGHLVLTVAPE